MPEETLRRAREPLSRGKKIQAIKEVREASGLDLQDAKDLVDALEADQDVPVISERPAPGTSLAHRVRELRSAGRMIEAIRCVVEETGMTETEATRFIDALD